MRVLFIAHNFDGRVRQGIMSLSAILKANEFEVRFLNTTRYEEANAFVRETSPDLLAYSCLSGEFNHYNEMNRRLKIHGILSVVGGPHATYFSREFMQDEATSFDGACVGEGEYALLELCEALRDGRDYLNAKNWIFKTDDAALVANTVRPLIDNLDELPFPDYALDTDILSDAKMVFWFHRGCPFNCTYCMNPQWRALYKGKGPPMRVPSPQRCIDLINHRRRLPGNTARLVYFNDDTFGHNMEWLKSFCDLYKKEIGLPWETGLYPTMMTEERLSLMADAGCITINTAIETGNEQRRAKLLKRPMTNDQIIDAAGRVHRYGMGLRTQNMFLLPGETFKDAMETFDLNIRCRSDIATVSKFQPYPGVALTQTAIDMGHLEKGNFEKNLPDNFHWISLLTFPNAREVNKINNLLHFFTFGTYFPILKPLILLLIKLPNNRFFHHVDNVTYKVITKRREEELPGGILRKLKYFMRFLYRLLHPAEIRYTCRRKVAVDMKLNQS